MRLAQLNPSLFIFSFHLFIRSVQPLWFSFQWPSMSLGPCGPLGPVQSGQVVGINKWSFWVTFVTGTGPDTSPGPDYSPGTKHTFHPGVNPQLFKKVWEYFLQTWTCKMTTWEALKYSFLIMLPCCTCTHAKGRGKKKQFFCKNLKVNRSSLK